MPEKHLFVNYSHYQDRPDPNMRHKMASHAAKYGPNGTLAFTTSERTSTQAERSTSATSSRHSSVQATSNRATPQQRSEGVNQASSDSALSKDYEAILARFDDVCACVGSSEANDPQCKAKFVHSEECSLLEDYLDLVAQHELPFRVVSVSQQPAFGLIPAQKRCDIVTQCLLVAGQAAVDSLNPKFDGKASKQTLTLQQNALGAMQKLIAKRPTTVDDSLVLASTVLMAIAVRTSSPNLEFVALMTFTGVLR